MPQIVDTSDWEAVLQFLREAEKEGILALDVETDGIDALTCNLLTVGMAWSSEDGREAALSLPWPAAFPDYWSAEQASYITQWLTEYLSDSRRTVVFHNKGYDVPVLRRAVCEIEALCEDTLLLHHAVCPKLPHTLEHVTSQYLCSEPWKSDYHYSEVERAWDAAEDWDDAEEAEKVREGLAARALGELLWYNAADAAATIKLYYLLWALATVDGVLDVYQRDNELLDLSIDWHRDGVGVDLPRAQALEGDYRLELDTWGQGLREMCGFPDQGDLDARLEGINGALGWWAAEAKECRADLKWALKVEGALVEEAEEALKQAEDHIKRIRALRKVAKKAISWQTFNPNSPPQLREALTHRRLTPTKVTKKTMEASTSKASLWDLRGDEFVDLLFRWRSKHKLWSTYLKPMARKIHEDGRIHPVWKLHSTPSGRYGTQPAVQNWPDDMKALMISAPGCKLVGADYAALELRVVALLSGEYEWIDTFQRGGDLHAAMAYYYFPADFTRLDAEWQDVEGTDEEKDKAVPGRKALRKAGKSVTFGDIYLASAPTLYEQIREERPEVKTRSEQARLLREVTAMQARLRAATPSRLAWANLMHKEAESNFGLSTMRWTDVLEGQVAEVQGGRQRKWPMGEASPNETANHPIQGMAADIVNHATRRLARWLKALGLYRNGIWMVLQVHDALYLEVEDITLAEAFPQGLREVRRVVYTFPQHATESLLDALDSQVHLPVFAARLLEAAMVTKIVATSPVTHETNWMLFPATAQVGTNIKEV